MRESVIFEQEAKEKGRIEGFAAGRVEGIQEVAQRLLNMGMTVEQVAQGTGLSVEQVEALRDG
ncbi:hypothetical protein PN462_11910 [Spirulina sp. CS-785/01]|uniref:hypothetical protein n=1 Tax=Spirulina sp. CS-785/01 TaxID=3021716 RepID=UPI00232E0250|nr:hypothetical protein [Spirulina sp. CS-785/01]MDB9313808.1 hypothetical protein [Spirulina sp. CS-785/01]